MRPIRALVVLPVPASLAATRKAVLMALRHPLTAARRCERAVLHDAARGESGYACGMPTRQKLEALYRCRLEPLEGPGVQAFFPSPH